MAAFQATTGSARGRVTLYLAEERGYWRARFSSDPGAGERAPGFRRFLLRRLYTGKHKRLEGLRSVFIGYDLDGDDASLKSVTGAEVVQVEVIAPPSDDPDRDFEGAFPMDDLQLP